MKEYTTLEALKALMENTKLVFEDIHNGKGTRIGHPQGFDDIAWLYLEGTWKADIIISRDFLNRKWTIAEQPVSFMEAINSGKRIKAESWNGRIGYEPIEVVFSILSSDSYTDLQTMFNAINGNWYIKEEE